MDNIKNKTALVTGGASGLGLTYVQMLLQNGAKAVAILDLSSSAGQTAVATLEREFGKGKAVFYPCDVCKLEEFADLFRKIWKAWNGLDIVINNAGILNDDKWELTVKVNVAGLVQGSLLAIEHMGKHKGGKGGTIVNIASIVALQVFRVCPVYCASKHDVLAFSRCLQENYNNHGVRVLVMCPGVTTTSLFNEIEIKGFSFIKPGEIQAALDSLPSQGPDNVGRAMMNLLQKGKNGSVWVSEGGEPPYAVEFPPLKRVELNL